MRGNDDDKKKKEENWEACKTQKGTKTEEQKGKKNERTNTHGTWNEVAKEAIYKYTIYL